MTTNVFRVLSVIISLIFCVPLLIFTQGPGGSLSNVKVWLKADQGVTLNAAGKAVTWVDQSSTGNSVNQSSSGSKRPFLVQDVANFNPALRFDGNDVLNRGSATFNGSSGRTFYYVAKSNSNVQTAVLYVGGNTAYYNESICFGGKKNSLVFIFDGVHSAGSGSNVGGSVKLNHSNAGQPVLATGRASTGSINFGNYNLSAKGYDLLSTGSISSGFTAVGGSADLPSTCRLQIGARRNGSGSNVANFDGDIMEVIFIESGVGAGRGRRIESYLALKYGITLGNNGTSTNYFGSNSDVIWDQSANAGYNYDIAGIRRDDNTVLDQRKSRSENKTSGNYNDIITMANGSHFSAPAAIGTNRSSIIWGHNNAPLAGTWPPPTFSTTNSEGIQSLFQRSWKVQEEGTMGTVTLQFDMSSVVGVSGVGTNDLAHLRLLVDADGVFTSGALSIAPSTYDNTTNLVEFQHDFSGASGFYFSLGSVNFTNTPLPVELNNFTAECFNEGVEVKWQTELEINSDYFELQKSSDGDNWNTIFKVNGAGNSTSHKEYRFLDESGTDINYYRLKQIDYNGDETVYKTILARCGIAPLFDTYPNPFESELNIRTDLFLSKELKVELRNTLGQLVHSETFSDIKDNLTLNLMPDLQPGTYILSILGENRRYSQLVMKSGL